MSIISNILSSLNSTSGNISLKQGTSFRGMQNQIVSSVMPQLPLISKSSGNNIFSVEGFSNPSKALEDEIKKEEKDLANAKSKITKMEKDTAGINVDFESPKAKLIYYNNVNYDTQSNTLYSDIGKNVGELKNKIPQVESQQKKIKRLTTSGHTLRGELEDNTLQMNSQYLRYFIWFTAAVTLGLVAVKKASN
jgi:hypothetical protein|tara:strand:+ start:10 stop:588 length:579 start_codon:yes stop_codon:yes gene_type:complete